MGLEMCTIGVWFIIMRYDLCDNTLISNQIHSAYYYKIINSTVVKLRLGEFQLFQR